MRKSAAQCCACVAMLWIGGGTIAGSADCQVDFKPKSSSIYSVDIVTSGVRRKLTPDFFGFNLEWVEFQLSLWDSKAQRVNSDVVEWMKAFPGATYRYPGGTVANYFEWRDAIGPPPGRKPQRPVTWRGALAVEFGPHEYMDFVSAVGGRPWYVLNLYGTMTGERHPTEMASEAADLVSFFLKANAAGSPAVFRWELGNELDRETFLWRPEKYADVANLVATTVSQVDKDAKFVALSQDWSASKEKYGIDAVTYNTALGKALQGKVTEFASHHYYDGRPWGPPVPDQLRQHCRNLTAIAGASVRAARIWVTEQGKTPRGTPSDKNWKDNWPQSADLSAAISVADMIIALAQDPAVNGQFLHALHATDGPWPLFHRNRVGGLAPSAVYWGLRTLRDTMLEEVLTTGVSSANQSAYEGGYDLRAVGLTNIDRTKISIWLANRASNPIQVFVKLALLTNAQVNADVTTLASPDSSTSNYGAVTRIRPRYDTRSLVFDSNGGVVLSVPANAVMSVSVPVVVNKK